MAAAGPTQRGGRMSIGAVLEQLRPDFPEVTISKIRFLEAEGLIRPARTQSGYRQFAAVDIERLRFVLRAQRDHYLPLRVIKEQLDSDRGGAVSGGPGEMPGPEIRLPVPAGPALPGRRQAGPVPDTGPSAPSGLDADGRDRPAGAYSREDFLAETGLAAADLRDLEQYGLLRADDDGRYAGELVAVARTAVAMMAFGIEPRHLRAFRTAADRQVGLLAQLLTPVARQRGADARAKADAMGRELAALSVALHTVLIEVGLRDAIRG